MTVMLMTLTITMIIMMVKGNSKKVIIIKKSDE